MSRRGKSAKTDKEYTQVQKLAHENKLLQREVAKLRRQLEKNEHMILMGPLDPSEPNEELAEMTKKIKKRPCHKCGTGFLYIIKYDRAGDPYYYRQCSDCDNRTRGQKYTENTED